MPATSFQIVTNDGPNSAGDTFSIKGEAVSGLSITNNTGQSIAYSTNSGSSFTTLTAGSTAALGSGTPDKFRFRRVSSGAYPLSIDATATIVDTLTPTLSIDANGNTALVGADGVAISSTASIKFCIPGRDTSVSFTDVSDNTATMTVDAANTGAFATADYISSILATNGGLTIPNAKLPWNPATQSLVMGFVLKKAIPVASESIIGVSGGTGANQTGFYVSHRVTSGALKIVPTIAGVIVNAQADSTLAFSDGTPQDRHCTIAYDAPTGIFYIYRDGVLSNAFTGTPMVGASAYPSANVAHEYRVGGTAGGATVSTVATATYGHQLYVIRGGLPTHIGRIAALLADRPRRPLGILEFAA